VATAKKRRNWYHGSVSNQPPLVVRKCRVSFKDTRGFTHETDVHTTSVLQAAASGLKWIEESDLLEGCSLIGDVQVEVLTRTIHTVALGRLREWLNSGGTPKEVAMKRELRERKSSPPGGRA
jgi:hypothetical protein